MVSAHQGRDTLIAKIRELPDDRAAVVEDFVDFLRQRDDDSGLVSSPCSIAERSLSEVWDNPTDADYDRL